MGMQENYFGIFNILLVTLDIVYENNKLIDVYIFKINFLLYLNKLDHFVFTNVPLIVYS